MRMPAEIFLGDSAVMSKNKGCGVFGVRIYDLISYAKGLL